jgi:outer membrane immunogenic protein
VTPKAVVYATAGIALQDIEATVNCTAAGACGLALAPFTASASKVLLGWTAGGGVEVALTDSLVARAEYRYADYGSFSAVYGSAANIAVASDIDLSTHTALIGMAVKLDKLR